MSIPAASSFHSVGQKTAGQKGKGLPCTGRAPRPDAPLRSVGRIGDRGRPRDQQGLRPWSYRAPPRPRETPPPPAPPPWNPVSPSVSSFRAGRDFRFRRWATKLGAEQLISLSRSRWRGLAFRSSPSPRSPGLPRGTCAGERPSPPPAPPSSAAHRWVGAGGRGGGRGSGEALACGVCRLVGLTWPWGPAKCPREEGVQFWIPQMGLFRPDLGPLNRAQVVGGVGPRPLQRRRGFFFWAGWSRHFLAL